MIWQDYVKKIEKNFKIKTYPHLDPYFNFKTSKKALYKLLSNQISVSKHPFLPFIKILQKTPRYRYQEDKGYYELETKIRPISFASHYDSYIYSFYSFIINEQYQNYIRTNGFSEAVYAYRNDLDGNCNIQFAKEVFDNIKNFQNEFGDCTAIALDIKSYFDNIDHSILKSKWCKIIDKCELPPDHYNIYRSLTKYSYINLNSFLKHFKIKALKSKLTNGSILNMIPNELSLSTMKHRLNLLRKRKLITQNSEIDKSINKRVLKKRGIPQGSPLSAILSNVYLLDFDDYFYKKGTEENFFYRRYCDDILIICKKEKANNLINLLMKKINVEYKLTIQNKKTEVIDFISTDSKLRSYKREFNELDDKYEYAIIDEKNVNKLQYLGFEFNGEKIYIRPSSLSRYFKKLKARIFKSVSMAYSKNSKSDKIFKKQIFSRYSHFGKRNFLSYAYNASKKYYKNSKGEFKDGMDSISIKRQLSTHMHILEREIAKRSKKRAIFKDSDKIKE